MSTKLKIVTHEPVKIIERIPAKGIWKEIPEKWVSLGVGYDDLKPNPILKFGYGNSPEESRKDAKKKFEKLNI